ncbi:MAG: DoxX family protein [Prolixibacteraceae bacterium]|jgi:uncharacterized membrane protein YphA (DoxX/SURF4 family)|nr:DoxX family protein [Prolixibacteraceae bacterium]
MDLFILIAAIVVSLVFLVAGTVKLIKSYESVNDQTKWLSENSISYIRLISVAEIIGAILFILPSYFNFLPFLSTIAAFGLVVLMIGAPITHVKLGEHKEAALTTLLLIVILIITFVRIFT